MSIINGLCQWSLSLPLNESLWNNHPLKNTSYLKSSPLNVQLGIFKGRNVCLGTPDDDDDGITSGKGCHDIRDGQTESTKRTKKYQKWKLKTYSFSGY